MTAALAPAPRFRAEGNNGQPLAAGQLFSYQAGTNNPQATWTDATQLHINTNPVVLDGRGEANVWLDTSLLYKLVLADSNGNIIWTIDNIAGGPIVSTPSIFGANLLPAVTNTYSLGSASVSWSNVYLGINKTPVMDGGGNIGYIVTTTAENNAGVTVTNHLYQPGYPERYGAVGDGATDDSVAITACFAANDTIWLSANKTYLCGGVTITSAGVRVIGLGGGIAATLLLKSTATFMIQLVSGGGPTNQFASAFVGSNFAIESQATSSIPQIGIWCNNASIQYLDNVIINMSNGYVGSGVWGYGSSSHFPLSLPATASYGLYGWFQQDGVFNKCTFTVGNGAFADGVCLIGSFPGNATPNNNLFNGCRSQSNGGYGVRVTVGDGNVWMGGKIQNNTSGGWVEFGDGLGNGPTNVRILHTGFEVNSGTADLYLNICSLGRIEGCNFESSAVSNAIYAPSTAFVTNFTFEGNSCQGGTPVQLLGTVASVAGNIWKENNLGFSSITFGGAAQVTETGSFILGYGLTINADCSKGSFFIINITSNGAFTIALPTNAKVGATYTYQLINANGGPISGSSVFAPQFHLQGGSFPFNAIAAGNSRTISFRYRFDGSFVEISRSTADII